VERTEKGEIVDPPFLITHKLKLDGGPAMLFTYLPRQRKPLHQAVLKA
jgi:hypothetical protein